ncbi:hypothetical protein SRS16CHR_05022 [Variovorax sp. SRS16]|uniref:hypothetical protein n=1 Tax=Variovorax sp. SRS16 TaxID=282217 RepID=UPI0013168F2F|nr:hypothetical protein [Variovorax sp. SRS16]VTU32119.1 hypothetical protein SRS16CHR_05022 [Variovorax sp. SRS16]
MPDRHVADRQAFLRLAQEMHRELAVPVPPIHLESDDSMALSLDLGDASIEIIHSLTRNSSSVLLDCEVGRVPHGPADASEYRLLCASGELFRMRPASLGMDAVRQAIFCSQWRSLVSLTAADLLAEALALARPLRDWVRAGLHDDHWPGVLGTCTRCSSTTSDDAVHWRRVFRAAVESLGAGRAPAGDHVGEAGSSVDVEIIHDGISFSMAHSLEAPRRLTLELTLGPCADLPAGETALLLQFNRELSRDDGAAFSVARQRDLMRFACALDLEALGTESLRRRMTELAVLMK